MAGDPDDAILYISAIEGEPNGEIIRLSIQQGTRIVARFELSGGDFLKAIRGRVTPVKLIKRAK